MSVRALSLVILALAACSRTDAADRASIERADAEMRSAMADSTQWPSYGRDYSNQRFSPLAQITAANVKGLGLAWHYQTGIIKAFEASPIVRDGVMYISTPLDHVIALDAKSGAKKWEFDPGLATTIMCCGPVSRGLAVYGGRVFIGTLDAHLVALDAASGHELWRVKVADNERGYAITMPAVAVANKVIVGLSGAEYGVRGEVDAFDAATGRRIWRFHTIPSPDEAPNGWWGQWKKTDPFGTPLLRDIAQEKRDSAKYADAWKTGGGSVWQAPSVDTQLGMVYFGVCNPSPDIDGTVRPGDNLYTNSVVALDLETGKLKWYVQEVPHDMFDWDAVSPTILFDTKDAQGRPVKAIAQAGKTGWVYVLDRTNGTPIRRSDPFVPQQNMFAHPTRTGVFIAPGGNGGSEWSAHAYSPQTGYMYVLGLHQPDLYKLRPEKLEKGASWLSGVWLSALQEKDQFGTISAVDLNTGKIAWQVKDAQPMVGGALATAGGVVFTGNKERQFLALDARTGAQLWQYSATAGVNAPPISYMIDGVQYVAVAAGGNLQINSPRGDEILVFSLGASANPVFPSPGSASKQPLNR